MRGTALIAAIIIIAMLAALLGVRMFAPDALGGGEQARMVTLVGWLAMLSAATFMFGRMPLGAAVKSLLIWAGILLFLIALYALRDDFRTLYLKMRGEILPASPVELASGGEAIEKGRAEGGMAMLHLSRDGHFWTDAQVNGARVRFMVDTGASVVTLTQRDAQKVGLSPDTLRYTIPVSTANGMAYAASVRLRSVNVGGVRLENVDAMVAQDDRLGVSLLGMSFLNRLSRYEVSQDRLILRR